MILKDILRTVLHAVNSCISPPFGSYKNLLSRVNNDHYEVISIDLFSGSKTYDILFGAYALCDPNCVHKRGYMSVAQLTMNYYDGLPIENKAKSRELFFRETVLPIFDNYVIPFFSKCNDSSSTLAEAIAILERIENNRLKSLSLFGSRDEAIEDHSKRIALSPDLFYLALKSSNQSFVDKHLQSRIAVCKKAIDDISIRLTVDSSDTQFNLRQKERFVKRLDQLNSLVAISHDPGLLQDFIKKNERNAFDELKAQSAN